MTEEYKEDERHVSTPEQRIAQRRLQVQENIAILATPLEHLSEEEIKGYTKKRLTDLANIHDIRHGKNISQGQLIEKLLTRRREMLEDITLMERTRERNNPNDISALPTAQDASNNNNNTDLAHPIVDGPDPTMGELRTSDELNPDPPNVFKEDNNPARLTTPEVRYKGDINQEGGYAKEHGGDDFTSTPAGLSRTSQVSMDDIS